MKQDLRWNIKSYRRSGATQSPLTCALPIISFEWVSSIQASSLRGEDSEDLHNSLRIVHPKTYWILFQYVAEAKALSVLDWLRSWLRLCSCPRCNSVGGVVAWHCQGQQSVESGRRKCHGVSGLLSQEVWWQFRFLHLQPGTMWVGQLMWPCGAAQLSPWRICCRGRLCEYDSWCKRGLPWYQS